MLVVVHHDFDLTLISFQAGRLGPGRRASGKL